MQELKAGRRPPWVGLAAAVWVLVAAGNAYTFPLYSPSLKSVLGYNQQQLTMLGVANDIGENFGLIAGFASSRCRPWLVLFAGAACCFLGFGVLWLTVTQTVTGLPFWTVSSSFSPLLHVTFITFAWLVTGVLVTNMRNFPLSRGTVSGILKGYVGLSLSVFTSLYAGVLHSSSTNLLLFLAIGLPVICLAMMCTVRPCTPSLEEENSSEHGHFLFIQISSVLLGLYLLSFTIVNSYVSLGDGITCLCFGIMVVFLLAPLVIPLKMTFFPAANKEQTVVEIPCSGSSDHLSTGGQDKTEQPLLAASSTYELGNVQEVDDVEMLLAVGEGAVKKKKKRRPKRGDDFELHEALIKADFWLLFMAFFIGVGSGVTVLNNLAQIGIAVGVDDPTILLCLFGFGNFLGRLGGGAVSEHFVRCGCFLWLSQSFITFDELLMSVVVVAGQECFLGQFGWHAHKYS
ncbi:hypothetical protein BHM03_00060417 [Ensete ventricosum]|nr:hypothetical protein BHM03_00060417 [Ensete ventricosum]